MERQKKEIPDVFCRVEDKYPMTKKQAEEFVEAIREHVREDAYFRYTVHSVYYDSADCQLAVHSLMKPKYKMKLRLRCYGEADGDTPAFFETKKKYGDIVFKKRITLTENEALNYAENGVMHHVTGNTADEIDYLFRYYDLQPKVHISYDRECWSSISEQDVRITFDFNIRYRTDDLSLRENGSEQKLFDDDTVVMEVKAMDRYPMWLVRLLSERKLYKQSNSKYGKIYTLHQQELNPQFGTAYALTGMNAKEKMVCSVQY